MTTLMLLATVLSLNGEWKLDYWPQPDCGAVNNIVLTERGDLASYGVLCVDAKNGDFCLKPDSSALAVGFRPFDFSRAGVTGAMKGKL